MGWRRRKSIAVAFSVDALSPPPAALSRGDLPPPGGGGLVALLLAVALVAFTLLAPAMAVAQDTPFVPDEWKFGRRQAGSTLQYCLDVRDPDLPVARRIGKAIADALLLEPKPHELGANSVGEDIDNLYRVFLETCEVYLGFKLIPDAYPSWLTVTRALLSDELCGS